MINFFLIRHAETAGNLKGNYIGITDEKLCEEGRKESCRRIFPKADAVFVSPLKRCRETAAILYPAVSYSSQQVITDFRECDFGDFENKNYITLSKNPKYREWIDSEGKMPFPNGESMEKMKIRCRSAFKNVIFTCIAQNYNNAAVVVHGGTIMSIMSSCPVFRNGLKLEKEFYDWQVKNLEGFYVRIFIEDWKKGKYQIQLLGKLEGEREFCT